MESFEDALEEVVLIPSRGGVFEVHLGDEVVFSKKATGRHAEHDDIIKELGKRLS